MPALRRLAALLLLSLWLPALLHCRLEAAGVFPAESCCANEAAAKAKDTCADDACATAEGEFQAPAALKILPPALSPCASLLCACDPGLNLLVACAPAQEGVTEISAAPPGLAWMWIFAERAALPPRAP